MLFADEEGGLWEVEGDDGYQVLPWEAEWDWRGQGWKEVIRVSFLAGSPDGELVLCGFTVRPPDDAVPYPEAMVVFDSDGENGRPVALSFNVGCGPLFDFTMDSRKVFGIPFLGCSPDAEGFLELQSGSGEYDPTDMVDLCSGERSSHGGYLSDGFISSPYSDLVCCGYPPYLIYDMASSEVLLESEDDFHPLIDSWVLPDAGVVSTSTGQILRYADGTEVENPGDPIDFLLALPDGGYLCGLDDGVYLAGMDWDTFEMTDPVPQPDLAGRFWYEICVQNDRAFFQVDDSLFVTPLRR